MSTTDNLKTMGVSISIAVASFVFALIGAASLAACSKSADPTLERTIHPSPTAMEIPSATHTTVPRSVATIEETVDPKLTPTIVPATATVHNSSGLKGPSSLDEVILHSEIIAHVRLQSAKPTHETVTDSDGTTKHFAVFQFKFSVIEYVKGTSGDEIIVTVRVNVHDDSGDIASAQEDADYFFVGRDARWDDREALIFLESDDITFQTVSDSSGSSPNALRFTDPGELPPNIDEYAISSSMNKVWLPSASSRSVIGESDNLQPARFLTDTPGWSSVSKLNTETVTIDDIKNRMASIQAKLDKGKDIPGYEECIRLSYRFDAYNRGGLWARAWVTEKRIESGLPSGHRLWSENYPGTEYYTRWTLAGPDADLFALNIVNDSDNDPSTGYTWEKTTTRPLPSGTYNVFNNGQPWRWVPCNYDPEWGKNKQGSRIIVTASEGTLHEAFFDPVALTNPSDGIGVRYNPKTSFTLPDKTSVTLDYLYYAPGIVKMRTTPHSALSGYEMDIIELNGKVSSTFAFGGSGSTSAPHEWATCAQPWDVGDKLMLRIRESEGPSIEGVQPCPTYIPPSGPSDSDKSAIKSIYKSTYHSKH